jgi:hypothetical protein
MVPHTVVPMPPPAGFVMTVPLGSTLAVRVGTAALAVKVACSMQLHLLPLNTPTQVFECDGAGGHVGRLELRADAVGLDLGAMRLVGQHFQV